jgi:hypothetical protein
MAVLGLIVGSGVAARAAGPVAGLDEGPAPASGLQLVWVLRRQRVTRVVY